MTWKFLQQTTSTYDHLILCFNNPLWLVTIILLPSWCKVFFGSWNVETLGKVGLQSKISLSDFSVQNRNFIIIAKITTIWSYKAGDYCFKCTWLKYCSRIGQFVHADHSELHWQQKFSAHRRCPRSIHTRSPIYGAHKRKHTSSKYQNKLR